jgi:hypothetical protein
MRSKTELREEHVTGISRSHKSNCGKGDSQKMRTKLLSATIIMLLLFSLGQIVFEIPLTSVHGQYQTSSTDVTYTIKITGIDTVGGQGITIGIDDQPHFIYTTTWSTTLDGMRSHEFRFLKTVCLIDRCETPYDKFTDWKKGTRYVYKGSMATEGTIDADPDTYVAWKVDAGSMQSSTQWGSEPNIICLSSTDTLYGHPTSGSSCYTYNQPYSYETQTFQPPCHPCEITVDYSVQYRLVVVDHNSPQPAKVQGWYDASQDAQVAGLDHDGPDADGNYYVTKNEPLGTREAFPLKGGGWAVDDDPTPSKLPGDTITMDSPHEITAIYVQQYEVTAYSPYGIVFIQGIEQTRYCCFSPGDLVTVSLDSATQYPSDLAVDPNLLRAMSPYSFDFLGWGDEGGPKFDLSGRWTGDTTYQFMMPAQPVNLLAYWDFGWLNAILFLLLWAIAVILMGYSADVILRYLSAIIERFGAL